MSIASSGSSTTISVDRPLPRLASSIRQRTADYAEMCRPRIALMTMVSVAVGFTIGSPIVFHGTVLLTALAGIVLLVAASSILNQCLESVTDRHMARTQNRPIAAGRLHLSEAAAVGMTAAVLGFSILWLFVNQNTAIATAATLLTYVLAYTPLKTRTSLCTTIGAIPGAMPPVLGWLAAGGSWGVETLCLFALFFVWQFPHFLAIGWIHRKDYQQAGLKMLPSFSDQGLLTGLFAVAYAAAFVPVSALPSYIGMAGDLYLLMAIGLSACYLFHSVAFLLDRSETKARQLLYVSLCCLPLLLVALVTDFLRLTAFG